MNKITAEIFVLKDGEGKLINDIDTDMIFHNKYLSIVDINLMGQYALDNLEGYKDFSKKVKDNQRARHTRRTYGKRRRLQVAL